MFLHNLALAAAGALILSGCAPAAWQRPANHPADPGQASGRVQPVSAFEQYRANKPAATNAPGSTAPKEDPHAGHGKEAKP